VLGAAMTLFMRDGFAATMDAIAAAARMSKRTLYARYPDKLVLFEAVLTWLASERTSAALSLPPALPVAEALVQYGLVLFDHYTNPRIAGFLRLMQKEYERFPEIYRVMREEVVRDQILPLKGYLDAQPPGVLRPVDTLFAATCFTRVVIGEISDFYASQAMPTRQAFAGTLRKAADLMGAGLTA
jgi:AcrR family transcriptional regulator